MRLAAVAVLLALLAGCSSEGMERDLQRQAHTGGVTPKNPGFPLLQR
jgi:hypothetical protein